MIKEIIVALTVAGVFKTIYKRQLCGQISHYITNNRYLNKVQTSKSEKSMNDRFTTKKNLRKLVRILVEGIQTRDFWLYKVRGEY